MIPAIPYVSRQATNKIAAHNQSNLNTAGQNPKKSVVQLNPIGAVFTSTPLDSIAFVYAMF